MECSSRPVDVEEGQKFDRAVVAKLVKVLEVFQNLED
jgi:hypothetical protein